MVRTPIKHVLINGYVCKNCGSLWDTKKSKYGRNPDPICKSCGSAAKDVVIPAKIYGMSCDCGKVWRPQRKIVERGTIMCATCHNTQIVTDKDRKLLYTKYVDQNDVEQTIRRTTNTTNTKK